MKKILQFRSVITIAIPQLLFYCILVFVFIVVNSTTSYAQQSKDSFALGTTSSFVKNFHDKAAFDNKTLRVKKPSVSLAISENKKFKLNIVMHNQFSQDEEEFVGNIDTLEGGSFFIRRINNKLEGHILFARKNKAYSLSSDNKGNAFVKEIDINKVICTNYGSNKKALDNKPIGIPSLPVGGTPTILSGPAYSAAIMSLESLHGANGCVLLDFDGQDVYGTPWNSTIDTIHALPSGLSESQILEVWKLVSEDYRPFNINITTSEAVFDSYPKTMRMRCIFTPTDTVGSGEGGIAYLQSFSWNDDTPCWSFEVNGTIKDAAEPASHEIGHTFGLVHQGRTLPVTGHEEYFSGQGNWGPIMGDAGYYVPLAQWSKGEYMYADDTEDELALIAAPAYGVGYRADDYGNTTATAAPLPIPNGYVNDSGFIGQTTDVDVFSYSIPAGKMHLDIKGIPNYTDLDVLAKLYNSTGTLIRTYDDTTSFNITIDTTLNAGNYYLSVEGTGTGNPLVTGYTKYASLGSYYITGYVPSTTPLPVVLSATDYGYLGLAYSFTVPGVNNGNAPATYTTTSTLPPGLTMNNLTGIISGTPTALGSYAVNIKAANSYGSSSGIDTIIIGYTTPTVTFAFGNGNVGQPFSYTVPTNYFPTHYSVTDGSLPSWATIDTLTGVITGVPPLSANTVIYEPNITVSNPGGSSTGQIVIYIAPPLPGAPAVIPATLTTALYSPFTDSVSATNSPTNYAAAGLPAGLTIDPLTGIITGTPTIPGVYNVTVTATNIYGSGNAITTINVVGVPIAPVVAPATTTGVVGNLFTYTIIAANGVTSYNSTTLPGGLILNTITGVISGTPTTAGTFTVTDTAKNSSGSGTGTLTITINNPPKPVVATASTTGTVGTIFSYTINATNAPTGFGSTILPAGLSLNIVTGNISGTPTAAGTFTITDTAKNSGGSGTGTLTITINPAKPIVAIASTTGTVGMVFSYTISATNAPTGYGSTTLPVGLSLNTITGIISGTPTTAGTFTITDTAKNISGSGIGILTITVNPAKPVVAAASTIGTEGTAFSYAISATNAPTGYGSTILPPGLSLNTVTGVISGTPTTVGTFTITDTAKNISGFGTGTLVITINSAKPVVTSTSINGTNGTAFSYAILATNSPTNYSVSALPAGLTLNNTTGVISGTPTLEGTYIVNVSATNIYGTGTGADTIIILYAPPFLDYDGIIVTLASPFNYPIIATNHPTSYHAVNLPAWATLDTLTGIISGTPNVLTFSIIDVTLTVTNPGGSSTNDLYIQINPGPIYTVPTVAPYTETATVGVPFTFTAYGTNFPASYAAANLPPGLSIDPPTGIVSGTPTTAGNYSVTITATNSYGSGSAITTINVMGVSSAPVVTSSTITGIVGNLFTYTISATNGATSYGSTTLPSGLVLNKTTGGISGTPTVSGTFTITDTAKNSGGSGTGTLTITINLAKPVVATASTTGTVGVPFSYTISATNSPTSYGSTILPAGLGLNATTGIITGTPTTAGTYTTTDTAKNISGSGTGTLTITINPAKPVVTSTSVNGTVGVLFSYTIAATNSPTSYGTSALPGGLIFNNVTGTISGTPTTAGTFTISDTARNITGFGVGTLTIIITVTVPPAPVVTSGSIAGTVGSSFSYTIIATN
ncbi:MAG TPA: putative Ig domain-containing protein, partial [Bacteroidia bacterium]|nr:putative Ig domain-containing protein [Bacteroidia bacterium]